LDIASSQEETTMLNTLTGDPDLSHPEDASTQNNGKNNLKHLPTYIYDNKLPDLVDFCVTKGIPQDFATVKSCFDLSSDHSPVSVTLTIHATNRKKNMFK
jgi:hypothetical protein